MLFLKMVQYFTYFAILTQRHLRNCASKILLASFGIIYINEILSCFESYGMAFACFPSNKNLIYIYVFFLHYSNMWVVK